MLWRKLSFVTVTVCDMMRAVVLEVTAPNVMAVGLTRTFACAEPANVKRIAAAAAIALTLILFLVAIFIFFPSISAAWATCRVLQARVTWITGSGRLFLQILFRPAGRLGGRPFNVRLVNRTKEGQGHDSLVVTGRAGPGCVFQTRQNVTANKNLE
jgi:hypothetical protein